MEQLVKDTLEKQMQRLSLLSAATSGNALVSYTEQIIKLANLLDPELRSQSYTAALQYLPSAKLTMSDLEEIAAARKEKSLRADKAFHQFVEKLQQTTPDQPLESSDTLSSQV